ncbi:hypothetical protein [Priestia megaterium]|nr:hypothetical protein [Priestia megaterium]
MIKEQGEDSCGKSGALHGNKQRCHKRSILDYLSRLFAFRFDF